MAGGGPIVTVGSSRASQYKGGLTLNVVLVAIMAAAGGGIFGYDIGITGGVTSMASFQRKFFPDVYAATSGATDTSPYCEYNNQTLQLFTSSLFLAGMVMSVFASSITRAFGRKKTMVFAGLWFMLGSGLNAGAHNLAMLVLGRIFLGFGVGSGNSVVPLYISEMAPARYRGGLNMMFQQATTIGILVAELINYGTQDLEWGWRLSLGLAAVPAAILALGGLILPESPNSLVERGDHKRGRAVLAKLRGTDDVDLEFEDIQDAAQQANQVTLMQSYKAIFTRKYSPMVIVSVLIAMFQQLTGINAIMFYVPVLFNSLGSSRTASLMNTCIVGAVNLVSTFVSVFSVDKVGRKFLFLEGGIQMAAAQIVTAIVLAVEFGSHNTADLPKGVAIGTLVVICVFVAGFAWSWGPLGWLVPSEIQTLETRPAGMSATVFSNFLFSFIIGQAFLSMLCSMKWGVFLFFAGFVIIMTIFTSLLLPETKGIPVEGVLPLFARHWFWSRVMGHHAADAIQHEADKNTAFAASQAEGAAGFKNLEAVVDKQ